MRGSSSLTGKVLFERIKNYATDISSKQEEEKKDSRLSEEELHEGRQEGLEAKAEKRAQAPLCMSEGFPSRERIKNRKDFARVWETGKKGETVSAVFFFLKNNLPFSRLGLKLSKKVGNAVRRNRIKRILREIYRRNKKDMTEKADLVLIPKQGIQDDYWKLDAEFQTIIKRINAVEAGKAVH